MKKFFFVRVVAITLSLSLFSGVPFVYGVEVNYCFPQGGRGGAGDFLFTLGVKLYEEGKLEEALHEFKKLLLINSQDSDTQEYIELIKADLEILRKAGYIFTEKEGEVVAERKMFPKRETLITKEPREEAISAALERMEKVLVTEERVPSVVMKIREEKPPSEKTEKIVVKEAPPPAIKREAKKPRGELTEEKKEEKKPAFSVKAIDYSTSISFYKVKPASGDETSDFRISKHLTMRGELFDRPSRLSADWDYSTDTTDISRLRRITFDTLDEKFRLILGDTSSTFSRYVMSGVAYRGMNLDLLYPSHTLTLVSGYSPYWLSLEEGYIYPRLVLGVKDSFRLFKRLDNILSLAYLRDSSSRMKRIDSAYKGIENIQLGLSQTFKPTKNWTLSGEFARTYLDEDIDDAASHIVGNGLFLQSDFINSKLRLLHSFERQGTNFSSLAGVTGPTGIYTGVGSDRQRVTSFFTYTPIKPIYFNLYYSGLETNLKNDPAKLATDYSQYRVNLRFLPPGPFPRITLTSSLADRIAFSSTANSDTTSESLSVGLFKSIKGVNLNATYTESETVDNLNLTEDTINEIYYLSASTRLFNRVSFLLSHSDTDAYTENASTDERSKTSQTKTTNLNLSSSLWGASNLSFSQNVSESKTFTTSTENTTYSSSLTFGWPYTKIIDNRPLSLSPSLSYNYSWDDLDTTARSTISSRLGAQYKPSSDTNLNLTFEYRDSDDNKDPSAGRREARTFITYSGRWSEGRTDSAASPTVSGWFDRLTLDLDQWLINGTQNFVTSTSTTRSELVYPLDGSVWILTGEYRLRPRLFIDLSLATSAIEKKRGSDTDWTTNVSSDPETRTTHISTGEARFHNMNLYYRMLEGSRFTCDGFVGYQHHRNYFEMTEGVYEIYNYAYNTQPFTGLNSRYKITYKGPRFGLRGEVFFNPRWSLRGRVAYAPWLETRGKGYWNLRSMVLDDSGGDGRGLDFELGITYRPLLTADLYFELGYRYLLLKNEGGTAKNITSTTTYTNWDSAECAYDGPYFTTFYRF